MKNPIQAILARQKIMVLDGAMATELERKGCDLNNELWSAIILKEQPELIKEVHYDYFKAGADCGISASYQATIEGFIKKGYSEQTAKDLIQSSIEILTSARNQFWQDNQDVTRPYPIVAASIGPYGAYLADGSEYRGDYPVGYEELKNFHRDRMKLLIDAGAEILAIETVPCLVEAQVTAELAGEFDIPCWISFSCKNDTQISDGTEIKVCVEALKELPQVVAIGLNCTAPEYVASLIKEADRVLTGSKPILVYPNSGEEYDAITKTWHGAKDGKTYQDWALEWVQAGARIIGGCCRTTPMDIAGVAELRNEISSN